MNGERGREREQKDMYSSHVKQTVSLLRNWETSPLFNTCGKTFSQLAQPLTHFPLLLKCFLNYGEAQNEQIALYVLPVNLIPLVYHR